MALLLVLRIARCGLVEPWPSGVDTLAAEQFCLDCKDILGSPILAKHVPDGGRQSLHPVTLFTRLYISSSSHGGLPKLFRWRRAISSA